MEVIGSAGLANTMAKILRQKIPEGRTPVLAKRSVENKDKRVLCGEDTDNNAKKKKMRQDWNELNHATLEDVSTDYEKSLMKIATKGVVQLFNAVSKQQKDIDKKLADAGSLESKKEKVLSSLSKKDFLGMLNWSSTKETASDKDNSKTEERTSQSKRKWSILDDDFIHSMTKMNQYDQDDSSNENEWSDDSDLN